MKLPTFRLRTLAAIAAATAPRRIGESMRVERRTHASNFAPLGLRWTIVALGMFSAPRPIASAQDHLEPDSGFLEAYDFEWEYKGKLRAVLLRDRSAYHPARMMSAPAFEPEWVVTVVRKEEGGDPREPRRAYFVEYAAAARRIYPEKEFREIKVTKARVELDRDTAEAVHRAWRRMLRGARHPEKIRFGADGVRYHFSRFVPLYSGGIRDPFPGRENGTIWTPTEGATTYQLVEVGEALREFAVSPPEQRQNRLAALRAKTNQLNAVLDKQHGNEGQAQLRKADASP
jgi:hypothetical protein